MKKIIFVSLFLIAACSNPCTTFSEKVCQRQGETSKPCAKAKHFSGRVSHQDQRMCKFALRLLKE